MGQATGSTDLLGRSHLRIVYKSCLSEWGHSTPRNRFCNRIYQEFQEDRVNPRSARRVPIGAYWSKEGRVEMHAELRVGSKARTVSAMQMWRKGFRSGQGKTDFNPSTSLGCDLYGNVMACSGIGFYWPRVSETGRNQSRL